MKKLFFVFVVVLLGTYVSNVADIDGKWKTTGGDLKMTYIFKVDGEV